MTIVAGFHFDGGVLLCADSQYTYGNAYKTPGDKIFYYDLNPRPLRIGLAIAGDIHRAKKGIDQIIAALELIDPQMPSGDAVFETIEKTHEKSYQRVLKHPKYLYGSGPEYNLLVSASLRGDTQLFITREDVLSRVDQWECAGSGDQLFRYLFQNMYRKGMDIDDVVIMAVHGVQEVKAFDPNVGFYSQFMAAWDGDRPFSNVAGYDVVHLERFSTLLMDSMYRLLFVSANLKYTDEQVRSAQQFFQDNLANLRRKYQEDRAERDAAMRILKILSEHREIEVTLKAPRGGTRLDIEIKGKEKW